MTYTRGDLDEMDLEALRINAAIAARCPIATALQAEITEALRPEYEAQRFGDRFALLASADRVCFEAQQAGRDLDLVGDGPLLGWDVATVALFAREMA